MTFKPKNFKMKKIENSKNDHSITVQTNFISHFAINCWSSANCFVWPSSMICLAKSSELITFRLDLRDIFYQMMRRKQNPNKTHRCICWTVDLLFACVYLSQFVYMNVVTDTRQYCRQYFSLTFQWTSEVDTFSSTLRNWIRQMYCKISWIFSFLNEIENNELVCNEKQIRIACVQKLDIQSTCILWPQFR